MKEQEKRGGDGEGRRAGGERMKERIEGLVRKRVTGKSHWCLRNKLAEKDKKKNAIWSSWKKKS